ncbi:GNAT family N-acetyltransferase [Acaryochloris sp. IP29b_bin.148]|uniref:GNAT family N-acetyltransferase n=1 Tax=Acaryochloris sp. IP29b_bin.148 TaxID=2969218 RepID=UPI00260B9C03|nr:GNAT family N-acetyltransferase [Acaryochloris sp. IP29b_bin.148]
MSDSQIKTATLAEADRCYAVLALAFGRDPAIRWMFSHPWQYAQIFPLFAQAFGGEAFQHNTATYVDPFKAVALWLPPSTQPDEQALGSLIQQAVDPENQTAVFSILEQLGEYHPQAPHWHLAIIGTDPVHQGQGCGSALLTHTLALCDQQQTPVYLEATNARNVSLYQTQGFEVLGTVQAGTSPTLYPMLRHPQ